MPMEWNYVIVEIPADADADVVAQEIVRSMEVVEAVPAHFDGFGQFVTAPERTVRGDA